MKFCDFLKQRREELGYSRSEVAEKANVTGNTYWTWETGACRPFIANAVKLSEVLEFPQEKLKEFQYTFEKNTNNPKLGISPTRLRHKFNNVLIGDHPLIERMRNNIEPLIDDVEEKIKRLEEYYDLLKM